LEKVADEGGSDLFISFNAAPMIKKEGNKSFTSWFGI